MMQESMPENTEASLIVYFGVSFLPFISIFLVNPRPPPRFVRVCGFFFPSTSLSLSLSLALCTQTQRKRRGVRPLSLDALPLLPLSFLEPFSPSRLIKRAFPLLFLTSLFCLSALAVKANRFVRAPSSTRTKKKDTRDVYLDLETVFYPGKNTKFECHGVNSAWSVYNLGTIIAYSLRHH